MTKFINYTIICVLLLACCFSCGTPTQPCGTFNFTGTAVTTSWGGGADINLDFNFDPSVCSNSCNCNTICYVQIVRVLDQTTGDYVAPNSDQLNRIVTGNPKATVNGWAVDRLSERNWGYYGRNNDNSFAGTLTPGSNTTAATLRDGPRWTPNVWMDFVTVPVCIDNAAPCTNSLIGYYYWLIAINKQGHNDDPFHEIGVDWNKESFDAAVAEWNADAPGLGKQSFPTFTRMAE